MISESIILSFFIRLYHIAMDAKIVRAFSAALDFIGRSFGESIFGKIFCRKESTDSYKEGSFFYGVFDRIWQSVLRFFGRIYDFIRRVNTESVNRKIFDSAVMGSYTFHMETLLAIVVCIIFLIPHDYWNNLYASILVLALFGVYFLCLLGGKKELGKSAKGVWLPFLFFAFITLFSVIGSLNVGDSIRVAVFFVTAFLLCLLVQGTCKKEENLSKLLSFMAVAVFVTAAYGIVQRILGVEADASLTDLDLNANMPGRVFSTLGNPNNFAEFLMLFTPFTFAFVLTEKNTLKKGFGLVATAMAVLALLLTYSRSGWLAFLVAVLVFIALYNKKLLPLVFLLGLMCIPLLPESILNRILTIGNLEDSSSSYRVDIWTGSIAMLRDGYWLYGTGLGAGAFTTVYPSYAVGTSRVAPHTHMQFMEMLAEMGILGLLAILWFSVSLVRRTAVWAGKTEGSLRAILCASAASMAGITAIGFVEYTWFYPRVMLAFFVCAGIAMACVKLAKEQQ